MLNDGAIRIDSHINTKGIDEGIDYIVHSIKGLEGMMNKVKGTALFIGAAKAIDQVAKSTAALEDSLRAASTLFGGVSVDMDNLRQRILQLSSETGIAAEEIGGALYEALSSGVPVTEDMGEAMDFLSESAKAARGGFADLTGTVTATAAVINAYGMSMSDAARVQGVLIQTQNKGMTTIGKLSTGLARVIPTAASFGVSLEQIGAALATTTAAGTQTDEAITGLNSLLSELGKQGQAGAESLADAAEAAGLGRKSFQELVESGMSVGDILSMMERHAEDTGRSMIDLFGSIEAGRTALQLTGDNAGRFAENLEAMNHTEGLTADAAARVTTGTERLVTALRNAGTVIGKTFEPAVQDTAGSLADMVNAMFGNTTEAETLKTAFDNVKTALENYRKAQENAKTATDETTEAMIRQNAQALRKTLLEASDAYSDAMKRLNELEVNAGWDWLGNPSEIAQQEEIVEGIRRNMQKIFNEALGEVSFEEGYRAMVETPELFSSDDLKNLDKYTTKLNSAGTALEDLKEEAEGLHATITDTRMSALQLYEDGTMGLSEIGGISKDLASWVLEADRAYRSGQEAASHYGEITEENMGAARDYISTLEEELLNVEAGSMEYVELKTTIEELTEAYNELAKATGKPLIGVDASAPAASGTPRKAAAPAMGTGFDIDSIRTADSVMAGFYETVRDNAAMAEALGDGFDEAGANAEAAGAALEELVRDFDLGPDNEDVRQLIEYLAQSEEQADKTKEALMEMAESAAQSLAQSMGSGLSTLITDLMTIDEQVEVLNEFLGDAEAEQVERAKALAEAEEEYRLALLEGNEEAIASSLENLEAAEAAKDAQDDKVKSLKEEIEATKNGSKAWQDFGKSVLESIADTLQGLGAQLAAQAVTALFGGDWVKFGIATGASAAAFIAAGTIRGLAGKYAEGGIVPQVAGVPSTGDQHLARVNPGELILNEAQQANIAQLLAAQEAMLDMRNSGSGSSSSTLTVVLDGDVYGLDSEEVGRAIYRNIRSLQEEGRIGRWR